jgi:hypothetical protein
MFKVSTSVLDKEYLQEDGSIYKIPRFQIKKLVYRDGKFSGYDFIVNRLWITLRLRAPYNG